MIETGKTKTIIANNKVVEAKKPWVLGRYDDFTLCKTEKTEKFEFFIRKKPETEIEKTETEMETLVPTF